MTTNKLNLCRRCAQSLRPDQPLLHRPPFLVPHLDFPTRPRTRTFLTKRFLSGKRNPPVLQISPPDPSSPSPCPPSQIRRDPGLTLGSNGIPVPPPPGSKKEDYTNEKSWAETVFRTLSGGMKSDYLKCPFPPLPPDLHPPSLEQVLTCRH
jgi:hypothetical protein